MSDVDVIVLDIDGGAMLAECLASVAAQTLAPRRVIVFDNGSRVPTRVEGTAVLLRSETNLGFTGGVNEAFRQVDAPFVALINNDVILDREWLRHVREAMDRDPRLAAVQTIIRREDGLIDGAGIDIGDGTFRQIGHGATLGTPLAVAWGVSATAALYRVEALGERVFDPAFFAYYEDVELCARLREHGWRIAVLPVVEATHRGSRSASVLGNEALRLRTRNRYRVAKLHPGVGRIRALLWEDLKLALRGRTSWRGMMQGLFA
ncbi:MAG TPA: glycosyltransferase family 2 protein [Thermoanaerobaculia bacterium]